VAAAYRAAHGCARRAGRGAGDERRAALRRAAPRCAAAIERGTGVDRHLVERSTRLLGGLVVASATDKFDASVARSSPA
jgi:hypothetical protein